MATSPLDPGSGPRTPDRSLGRGHGIRDLGPSDSSDNGSDLIGAPGLAQQVDGFGLDHPGTTSDPEEGFADFTAGPDVGDANLDGDSDRSGTGENASAGRDAIAEDGSDIGTDRIETIPDLGDLEDDDEEKKD